jgi:hypothetical protein
MRRNMPPAEPPSLIFGPAAAHLDAYRYSASYENEPHVPRLRAGRSGRLYGVLMRFLELITYRNKQ